MKAVAIFAAFIMVAAVAAIAVVSVEMQQNKIAPKEEK